MMAEAMAMKEGLSLANSKGCNSVITEGDSMETIQACTGSDVWWTELAPICADCVDLATSIGKVGFSYCQREANMCAHVKSRESFNSRFSCT
jgi:hypothetical protein